MLRTGTGTFDTLHASVLRSPERPGAVNMRRHRHIMYTLYRTGTYIVNYLALCWDSNPWHRGRELYVLPLSYLLKQLILRWGQSWPGRHWGGPPACGPAQPGTGQGGCSPWRQRCMAPAPSCTTLGGVYHRREAKVVAAVSGKWLNSLLFKFCTRMIWRIGIIHPILQIVLMQNSYHSKKFNQFCPPSSSDDLCHLFCIYPSSMGVILYYIMRSGTFIQVILIELAAEQHTVQKISLADKPSLSW